MLRRDHTYTPATTHFFFFFFYGPIDLIFKGRASVRYLYILYYTKPGTYVEKGRFSKDLVESFL